MPREGGYGAYRIGTMPQLGLFTSLRSRLSRDATADRNIPQV